MESQLKPPTHTRELTEPVSSKVEISTLMQLLKFLDVPQFRLLLRVDQLLLVLMLGDGRIIRRGFSVTAELTLIMLCCWWVLLMGPGKLRTHGVQLGVRRDSSDWHLETPVVFAFLLQFTHIDPIA